VCDSEKENYIRKSKIMGEEFDTSKNAARIVIFSRGWAYFLGSSKRYRHYLMPASFTCMANSSTMKMRAVTFI
jgi:hypothetical protein